MPRMFVVIIVALSAGILPLLPAGASSADGQRAVVSADPVDWTPHVLDGRVRGAATVGSTTVVVGDFTQVREHDGVEPVSRNDIFAFDDQGRISASFVPEVRGSEVFDVVPSGDGTSVIIAGSFRSVNGRPATSRVARVDVTTGQVVQTFKAPNFNNKVTALDLVDGVLYVAGWFTRVGGRPRTLLTALDGQTGADLNTIDLTFRRTWNGGVLGVAEMTVRPNGSSLVVIGNFRRVEDQFRPQVAMIDLRRGAASVDRWSTTRYATRCSRNKTTYMWGVDTSPNGRYFAIGTTGSYSGGPSTGTLCDTVARWEWRRHRPDRQPTWIDYTGGDTVTDIEVTDSAVYAGGHFRWFNNPYRRDAAGPGAVRRMGLAALDPRNGLPLGWDPGRQRGWGVWGFASTEQGLWVGHDTAVVGRETHERLALLPYQVDTGVVPPDNTGTLPGEVFMLGQKHDWGYDDTIVQLPFDGSSAGSPMQVENGAVRWSQARAAFMVDGRLYTAWPDGTLTRRTFDTFLFGEPRTLDLNGLTAFSDELAQTRAMWFDAAKGRLYFTLTGHGERLFYRYFTPDGNTVGAIRHEASNGDVNFGRVTSAFLAAGKLWYAKPSGALRSVTWRNGPVPGTSVRVSGSGVDEAPWNSRTFFLYAQ